MRSFDASRLRHGELLAGAGALVLLLVMFVDWYGLRLTTVSIGSVQIPGISEDAWTAFTVVDLYLAVTAAVALALVYTQATRRPPALPVALGVVLTVLGAIAMLLILYRIIDPPAYEPAGRPVPHVISQFLHLNVRAGAWLGLAAAAVIEIGAWRSMRTEGVAPQDEETEIETVALRGRTGRPPGGPSGGPAGSTTIPQR